MDHQTTRKKRVVKEWLVNLEDVETAPGYQCSNWIEPAKQKLKERESIVLKQRLERSMEVIQDAIISFSDEIQADIKHDDIIQIQMIANLNQMSYQQYLVHNTAIDKMQNACNHAFARRLSKYVGVRKSNKVINNFRDYFRISRNSVGQRTVQDLARYFWLPLFSHLKKMTEYTASQLFNSQCTDIKQEYSSYLFYFILTRLCAAKIRLPSTKFVLLISCGVYLEFVKKKMGQHILSDLLKSTPHYDGAPKRGEFMRDSTIKLINEKLIFHKNEFVRTLKTSDSQTDIFLNQDSKIESFHHPNTSEHKSSDIAQPLLRPISSLLTLCELANDENWNLLCHDSLYVDKNGVYFSELPLLPLIPMSPEPILFDRNHDLNHKANAFHDPEEHQPANANMTEPSLTPSSIDTFQFDPLSLPSLSMINTNQAHRNQNHQWTNNITSYCGTHQSNPCLQSQTYRDHPYQL